MQKINLKKPVKLMVFFLISQKKKIMIILVTLLLKTVVVKVDLVDSVDLVVQIFLIYLKISLEILVVEDVVLEEVVQTIEDLTSDMIYQYL